MDRNMRVVSVDDERINLRLIEEMSKELKLDVTSFLNPLEALEYIENNEVDMAFVDYLMPDMDGIEFIRNTRIHKSDIPIIMITAVTSDSELKLKALKSGATDFLNKPLDIGEFSARVKNLSDMRTAQLFYKNWATMLEDEVRKATENLRQREFETLSVLGKAAEYKDPETGNHIMRVAHYSKILARASGEESDKQELIFRAAPLHDVGKIAIPDQILLKPGRLTAEEFQIMKSHPTKGFEIIQRTKSHFLVAGAQIALTHHEKYDGSGYPAGLSGESIPIFGRIVAITDVFDALTSDRPYKDAWSFEKAVGYLSDEKDRHFDGHLIDHFLENLEEIRTIYHDYAET
jgi:response regulator RpfG family c-di-GMP phosphodiesterase